MAEEKVIKNKCHRQLQHTELKKKSFRNEIRKLPFIECFVAK
jgi:hypothetical protein